jgi:hypothetical protein
LALAALLLSGIGLLWRGPANSTGTAASAVAEYRKEARTLELAPGRHWPVAPPIATDSGYGKGYGTQMADSYWFCSWAARALDPRLSSAARRLALAQLPKLRSTYAYKHYIPDSRASMDAIIDKALRGDTSGLRANCGQ